MKYMPTKWRADDYQNWIRPKWHRYQHGGDLWEPKNGWKRGLQTATEPVTGTAPMRGTNEPKQSDELRRFERGDQEKRNWHWTTTVGTREKRTTQVLTIVALPLRFQLQKGSLVHRGGWQHVQGICRWINKRTSGSIRDKRRHSPKSRGNRLSEMRLCQRSQCIGCSRRLDGPTTAAAST